MRFLRGACRRSYTPRPAVHWREWCARFIARRPWASAHQSGNQPVQLLYLEAGVGLFAVGHMASATVPPDGLGIGRRFIEIPSRRVFPYQLEPTLGAFREADRIRSAVRLPIAGDLFESVGELRGIRRSRRLVLGRDILLQAAVGCADGLHPALIVAVALRKQPSAEPNSNESKAIDSSHSGHL